MSYTYKHAFSSIWKWIRRCNDVMNNGDCVIKRDVYPQKKMHSYSKYIRGILVFVLKISEVYKRIYMYHRYYCMAIPLVER